MTTITIPEAILSQIKPGEQAVEVRDATGRMIGRFAPLATLEDYRNTRPALSDDEFDRRIRAGGGRPLTDVLRDLERDRRR